MAVVLVVLAVGLGFALFVFAAIRAEGWSARHLLWLGYCGSLFLANLVVWVVAFTTTSDEEGQGWLGLLTLVNALLVGGIWLYGALVMWTIGWEGARKRRILVLLVLVAVAGRLIKVWAGWLT